MSQDTNQTTNDIPEPPGNGPVANIRLTDTSQSQSTPADQQTTSLEQEVSNTVPKLNVAELSATMTFDSGAINKSSPRIATQFGDYEIVGEIARGGMGVVYKARQNRLNRTVAIKMILAGNFASEIEIKRFYTEAEAAAQLDHSGIVPIYEVGERNGQHFFSMAFIDGQSLQSLLKQGPLASQHAAQLLHDVAVAVHYAHTKGIIHRDLKPHNILLDAEGKPKLTDFGLAKCVDSVDGLTASGEVMGTPSYMAPEQAAGKTHELGSLVDVYALGAILYAMLTGRPPFQAATLVETIMQVIEKEPVSPALLNPAVPRDLETICLKCLHKEPSKRYSSAAALADDLQCYLEGRPIQARPIGRMEVAWRWCRRNPALSSAISLALLGIVGGAALAVTMYFKEARHARNLNREMTAKEEALRISEELKAVAERESELARQKSILAQQKTALAQDRLLDLRRETAQLTLERGLALCEQGEIAKGLLWLSRALEAALEAEDRPIELVIRNQLGAWSRKIHPWQASLDHPGTIYTCVLSKDRKRIATGGSDGHVRVWDAMTLQPIGMPLKHSATVHSIAFHPDGRRIATGGDGPGVRLWDITTGKAIDEPLPYSGTVYSLAFDPKGKILLVAGRGGKIERWDTTTGELAGETIQVTGNVLSAVFSPDGQQFLIGMSPDPRGSAVYSGEVSIWDTATGTLVRPPLKHPGGVHAVVYHPDGRSFFTGCYDLKVRQYNSATGELLRTPIAHSSQVLSLAISADGQRLLAGGKDYVARLYDLTTEMPIGQPLPHREAVWAVALGLDGKTMFTTGAGNSIHAWNVAESGLRFPPLGSDGRAGGIGISSDGKEIYTASQNRRTAMRWDSQTGRLVGPSHREDSFLYCVAISPDGSTLATGASIGEPHARLWDSKTGEPLGEPMRHSNAVRAISFSSDGKLLATASFDGSARIWDTTTCQPMTPLLRHNKYVWSVKFSPDSKRLLSAGEDKVVRQWDVATGNPIEPTFEHPAEVFSVDISADGRFALTACRDHLVRVWDLKTGTLEGVPLGLDSEARSAVFSPDGLLVLTGCRDGTARLWDLATRKPIGARFEHPEVVDMVLFHPKERSLVTWCRDGKARLWEIPTLAEGTPEQIRCWCEVLAGMTIDKSDFYHPLDVTQRRTHRNRLDEMTRISTTSETAP
jgi:eukaryotic-like serine/threonine-protein kinase